MSAAVRLYRHTFDGADTPGSVGPWPGFEFPLEKGPGLINPQSGAQSGLTAPVSPWVNEPFIPTIDGQGHGQAAFGFASSTWLLRSESRPGQSDYKADLWARWKSSGRTTYEASVGLVARFLDNSNYLIARIVNKASGTPELRLWKVIAGTPTQLGTTYTGSAISAAALANGVRWRLRVKDNADGTTTVSVYTAPKGANGNGTSRITYTGAIPTLRGAYGTGVEIQGATQDQVVVDDHECYDLSDEGTADAGDGTGWVIEIDGTRYAASALGTHTPKVLDVEVTQSLGASAAQMTIRAHGDWCLQTGLRPGLLVKAFHDGALRFTGKIVSGQGQFSGAESQTWTAQNAMWAAGLVDLTEDDGSATLYFNVEDESADYYSDERQDMEIGEVAAFLFARERERLLFHGAIPSDADPFDQAELDAMTAVIPGLALSGSFQAAILQLVSKMRKYQPIVDEETGTWHFRDITNPDGEAIECTAEHVRPTVTMDSTKAVTAWEAVGSRKEAEDTDLAMNVPGHANSLEPMWTAAQEENVDGSKKLDREVSGVIAGAGAETFRGTTRIYFTLAASYGLTEDEWRGAWATCGAKSLFVVGNTTTKVYLAAATWSPDPTPSSGDAFSLSLLDERAAAYLSSKGVGRAFRAFGIPQICGVAAPGLYTNGVQAGAACGTARIGQLDPDTGVTSWEEVDFNVYMPSGPAISAGFCDPTVMLSRPPLRPIGLINRLGPMPGGSPPLPQCANPAVQMPQTQIKLGLKTLGDLPRVRRPAADDTYEGRAYDAWGTARLGRIQIPDFTRADQADGIAEALQSILDVTGDKPILLDAELSTPWKAHPNFPQNPTGYPTSQWAGLTKRVLLKSRKRTTGLEGDGVNLVVYAVTWSLLKGTTTLKCGTAAGWLNLDAAAIAQTFLDKAEHNKLRQQVASLGTKVACVVGQSESTVGAQPSGPVCGDNVEVIDTVRRTVTDVSTDDEHKKSGIQHALLAQEFAGQAAGLLPATFPGVDPAMPGYDGASAKTFTEAGGAIARTLPRTFLPGPIDSPGGDRSPYGGPRVTDRTLAGAPPAILATFPWGAVRKAPDASGDSAGGEAREWSPIDAQGVPTGSWAPLTSLLDLGGAGLPLRHVAPGSYPAQLAAREDGILDRLGIRTDADGRVLTPGTVTADYADGVPADLLTATLAVAAAGGHLALIPETVGETSGPVFHGPVGANGVDAGLDWMVLPPGRGLVLVTETTPGSGFNGSRWEVDTSGPGSAMTLLTDSAIVHKQIDANDLAADASGAITDAATSEGVDSPHAWSTGQSGMTLPGGGVKVSGAGGVRSMPVGSVGDIAVTAHVREVPTGAPEAANRTASILLSYSVKASAWTAVASTASQTIPVADGAGEGMAVAVFKVPGGAVPAGLRVPFDLSLSIQRSAGLGTMTLGLTVSGIGVDVAVATRSYLHRCPGSVGVGGTIAGNRGVAFGALALSRGVPVSHPTCVIAGSLGLAGWAHETDPLFEVVYGSIGLSGIATRLPGTDSFSGSIGIKGLVLARLI